MKDEVRELDATRREYAWEILALKWRADGKDCSLT